MDEKNTSIKCRALVFFRMSDKDLLDTAALTQTMFDNASSNLRDEILLLIVFGEAT